MTITEEVVAENRVRCLMCDTLFLDWLAYFAHDFAHYKKRDYRIERFAAAY